MVSFRSSFFKLPANSRFMYRPRHFDPEEEELKKRIKMIESDKKRQLDGINYREEWSNSYGDQWRNHASNTKTAQFNRVLRIFFFVAFLSTVAYVVFWS